MVCTSFPQHLTALPSSKSFHLPVFKYPGQYILLKAQAIIHTRCEANHPARRAHHQLPTINQHSTCLHWIKVKQLHQRPKTTTSVFFDLVDASSALDPHSNPSLPKWATAALLSQAIPRTKLTLLLTLVLINNLVPEISNAHSAPTLAEACRDKVFMLPLPNPRHRNDSMAQTKQDVFHKRVVRPGIGAIKRSYNRPLVHEKALAKLLGIAPGDFTLGRVVQELDPRKVGEHDVAIQENRGAVNSDAEYNGHDWKRVEHTLL
ncbi:hypothetical protein BCR44DRAFT_403937 [Catenaria anguillulae PL171]|uniref:Uncharacterized protein n=1 Tax=Catenaria anguillulae PL171 TaxID=765915 RepID=A0A1Y2HN28_9FUNG|nr:hypothetical protein BCR44DRAFT_403937 [Catenaria anguillulae PL171]